MKNTKQTTEAAPVIRQHPLIESGLMASMVNGGETVSIDRPADFVAPDFPEAAPVAGHTPGPWTIAGDAILDSCGNRLATVHEPFWRRGNEPEQNPVDTRCSNSRLIAAAPALLEALQRIESQPSLAGLHDTHYSPTARQIARAAISLAKGGV